MPKKISFTESEFPILEYQETFIIKELINDGFWLIKEEDEKKLFPKKFVVQLFNLGEKEDLPILKLNQRIRIRIKTV